MNITSKKQLGRLIISKLCGVVFYLIFIRFMFDVMTAFTGWNDLPGSVSASPWIMTFGQNRLAKMFGKMDTCPTRAACYKGESDDE
jgi:hypothetical protein